tara:strand:+ start:74 stop:949 length:876 start_codon:yes stop_codon:yes gene_type:complete
MKDKLLVSVSGGKTSGYMAEMIKRLYSEKYEILYIFANTGEENEATLQFLDTMDKAFNLDLVWLEAVVHDAGEATSYKLVDFKSASRNGEPFEEVIKKYGIPNKSYPHCNRELKLAPIHTYAKEYFGTKDYQTAIGIRIDEARRVSKDPKAKYNIVYPLIDWEMTDKIDINNWWEDQTFNLELKEHQGNCKTCFKKSTNKHFLLIDENPNQFDFNRRMEKYKSIGKHEDRVFFRSNRDTDSLFRLHKETAIDRAEQERMKRYIKDHQPDMFDENDGCGESCEPYQTEDILR